MSTFHNHHHAKLATHCDGALEKFFNLLRQSVGGDVVIAWLASEQKVAHAAANPECGEICRLQTANNLRGHVAQGSFRWSTHL
jgi:hypothetical protein